MEIMGTRKWRARTDRDSDKCEPFALVWIKADKGSDKVEGGKEVADFEGGGFRSVRTVRAVHLDAGAEVVSNRARCSFLGIGGAHGFAPF